MTKESTSDESSAYQVIVIGGGFAGVAAAKVLGKAGVKTLLIDRNYYQQFQPLLYQVATAQLPATDVSAPLRTLFRRHKSVRVLTADVVGVSAADHSVTLADGTVLSARILVIAAGAEVNFFGTPGAAEHSFPLYSVDDATKLSAAIVAELDDRDAALAEGEDVEPRGVVVVGGGATGVETAGAIAEAFQRVVPNYYSDELSATFSVHLVDRGPVVLGPFSEKSQSYAHERLEHLGVRFHLDTGVEEVHEDHVVLSDGSTLAADIVIWAGGLKACSVIGAAGLPTGRGGRLDVNPDLTVPGVDGVYALGDAANIPDGNGQSLPQLGSVAMQAGKWAGNNILADLEGEARTPFEYFDKGIMAMIGRGAAVAEVGSSRKQLEGELAFASWLGVHAALLPTWAQRADAVASWSRDYLTKSRRAFVVGAAEPGHGSPEGD